MKMERPCCFFCGKRIEYLQQVFAIHTPKGPGFSHIDHRVPDEIKRVQNEPLLYRVWVDRGYGMDVAVKEERRQSGEARASLLFSVAVLLFMFVWFISKPYACQPTTGSVIQAAENLGWSDIKITETFAYFPGWNGCAGSDSFAYHATATNPKGQKVRIVICSGNTWNEKGVTVRAQ